MSWDYYKLLSDYYGSLWNYVGITKDLWGITENSYEFLFYAFLAILRPAMPRRIMRFTAMGSQSQGITYLWLKGSGWGLWARGLGSAGLAWLGWNYAHKEFSKEFYKAVFSLGIWAS